MRLWHDSRIGGIPLKIQFSYIYEFCQKPDAMARDMWNGDEWNIPLRRCLYGSLITEWNELQGMLSWMTWERMKLNGPLISHRYYRPNQYISACLLGESRTT